MKYPIGIRIRNLKIMKKILLLSIVRPIKERGMKLTLM